MAAPRKNARRAISHYAHADKERLNNPPVGLVTLDTDRDAGKKTYAYDTAISGAVGAGRQHAWWVWPVVLGRVQGP